MDTETTMQTGTVVLSRVVYSHALALTPEEIAELGELERAYDLLG